VQIERRSFGRERKKRRGGFPKAFVAFIVVAVCAILWFFAALRPVDAGNDARVNFTVPAGAGFSTVTDGLEEKDVIRSPLALTIRARWKGKDRLVRAGTYVLKQSMSADEVLEVLTGGVTGEVSVTIPEGFTVADIDRMMAAKGFTETGAVLACSKTCAFADFDFLPATGGPGGRAEGYLYPDTYFVGGEGSDPEAFLGRLLTTFRAKVVDGLSSEIAASGKPLHEVVTMASLVEKEAAGDDERATIAGILWKRLDVGMILGVDAAVRYAVGKRTEPLTSADLDSNSPYNIRAKGGLPPGPIANPGIKSIEAALSPETTPYFYYLHGSDGVIHYAVTNDEHNANKARYLR
jgi:UPF0755 protein